MGETVDGFIDLTEGISFLVVSTRQIFHQLRKKEQETLRIKNE